MDAIFRSFLLCIILLSQSYTFQARLGTSESARQDLQKRYNKLKNEVSAYS